MKKLITELFLVFWYIITYVQLWSILHPARIMAEISVQKWKTKQNWATPKKP